MTFTEATTRIDNEIEKISNHLPKIADNLTLAVIDRINKNANVEATIKDMLAVITDLPEQYQLTVLSLVIANLIKSGNFKNFDNKNSYANKSEKKQRHIRTEIDDDLDFLF